MYTGIFSNVAFSMHSFTAKTSLLTSLSRNLQTLHYEQNSKNQTTVVG